MNRKLTMLAFALIFSCSPAFAEDCDKNGNDHCRQMKMEKTVSTSPARSQAAPVRSRAMTVKAVMRKVTKEEVGKEAVCPVKGDTFKVTAKTLSASYKGRVYYFCCPGCKKPFIKNPEKYLQKKQEP